eukprot:g13878.t1
MCHCACSIPGRMSATFFPMEDVRCNSAKCTDDTCRLTDSICADENARVEATGCFVDRDTDKDTNKDTDKDTDTEYDDTEDDKEKEYDVPEDDKQNSRMSQEAKALVDEEVAIMVHKSRVQDDAFLRYMVEMEQRVREKEAETAELRAQKSDTANVETSNSEQSVASAPTDKNNNDEDGNNTPYEDGDYAFRTQHDGTIEVIPASPPLPPPKPPGKPGKVADDGDEGEAQYPAHAVTEQDNGADWFEYYAKSVSGDSATWFTGAEEDTWFSVSNEGKDKNNDNDDDSEKNKNKDKNNDEVEEDQAVDSEENEEKEENEKTVDKKGSVIWYDIDVQDTPSMTDYEDVNQKELDTQGDDDDDTVSNNEQEENDNNGQQEVYFKRGQSASDPMETSQQTSSLPLRDNDRNKRIIFVSTSVALLAVFAFLYWYIRKYAPVKALPNNNNLNINTQPSLSSYLTKREASQDDDYRPMVKNVPPVWEPVYNYLHPEEEEV